MRIYSSVILIFLIQQVHFIFATTTTGENKFNAIIPNLPTDHLIRYLNTFPKLKEQCQTSKDCELFVNLSTSDAASNLVSDAACWGHERDCSRRQRFQTPTCPGQHTGWMHSKDAQVETFYNQADFGYIQQQINELRVICTANYITDSSLECTQYLRFCRGRNLMFDLRDLLMRPELIRYQMDVLKPGQMLGHCEFNRTRLYKEFDHMGALQSWAPELRNFEELPMPPLQSEKCDMVVNTPTYIMKIDATYNMYHHFCDFFNLYATLFVNQTHPSVFNTNVRILIWETYPYDSPFASTFRAFTHHPVWTLNDVKGKRVCFRNVVLPLLPRMIFGLYYNTPIILGCQNSGLFRAFSEFILHRLEIPIHVPSPKLRITFLSRRTTYRQVLNENDLIMEIIKNKDYEVRRVTFERSVSFADQLAIIRNTDILIGMHGAGLTHLLFLPNWATIFELYNCEDPNCYKDLARLRGVNYVTWEKIDLLYPQDEGHHPEGGAHAKFTNYAFDSNEFARLVEKSANHVRTHKDFQNHIEKQKGPLTETFKDEL